MRIETPHLGMITADDQGRGFSGAGNIPFSREWPRWAPAQNMLKRDPDLYQPHRGGMEGGKGTDPSNVRNMPPAHETEREGEPE